MENPGSAVFPRYAEDLAREGRTDEALDTLSRGIEANPSLASGYSVLADLLFSMHEEEKAVENLLTAVKIDPQMPRDLLRLGRHFLAHEPLKAGTYIRTAEIYHPDAGRFIEEIPAAAAPPSAADDTVAEETRLPSPDEARTGLPSADGMPPETEEIEPAVEKAYRVGTAIESALIEPDEDMRSLMESFQDDDGETPVLFDAEAALEPSGMESLDEPAVPENGAYTVSPADEPPPLDQIIEFGIPDMDEGDADKLKVLEIQEDEDYDLSRFGFDSGEDEDVLSPEERAELLKLSETHEPVGEDDEIPGVKSAAVSEEESPGSEELDEAQNHAAALFGRLSTEEIEVLSDMDREPAVAGSDLDTETSEGIDYSDVLSTWKPSDQALPLDADVEDALSASFTDDLIVEPPEAESFSSLSDFVTEEEYSPTISPAAETSFAASISEDSGTIEESFIPGGLEALESVPDEELTALNDTIADGGAFDELSETEEALIRDFASGMEPEHEEHEDSRFPESPLGADVERWVHADRPAFEQAEAYGGSSRSTTGEESAADSRASIRTVATLKTDKGGEESLDDLIDAYERVIGTDADDEPAPETGRRGSISDAVSTTGSEPPVFSQTASVFGTEPKKSKPARDSSGCTATMAEIYVSQGLLSRALEIFTVLADRDPDNSALRKRIDELKTLLEQNPES